MENLVAVSYRVGILRGPKIRGAGEPPPKDRVVPELLEEGLSPRHHAECGRSRSSGRPMSVGLRRRYAEKLLPPPRSTFQDHRTDPDRLARGPLD